MGLGGPSTGLRQPWRRQSGGAARVSSTNDLNKQLSEINKFGENCKGKYALFMDKVDNLKENCDLAINAKKYHKQFSQASITAYIKRNISNYNNAIDRLKEKNLVTTDKAREMSFGWKKTRNKITSAVINASEFAGLSTPSFDEIDKIPRKFEDAVEAISKIDSWDKVKYPMPNAFEDILEKVMKKRGEKYLKAGLSQKNWKIYKNGLGIPLTKSGFGYVLTRNSDDDGFERMYRVVFNKDYMGTGYQDASSVEIKYEFIPFDD